MTDSTLDYMPREFPGGPSTPSKHRDTSVLTEGNSIANLGTSTEPGSRSKVHSDHEVIQNSPATESTISETPHTTDKYAKSTVVNEHVEIYSSPESQPPPSKDSTRKWYSQALNKCSDLWVLELLSCGMAVACFVAIVVILAVYQDRPLPNSPDAISINSWISVFTAVMKAAIMLPVAEGTYLGWF
jgi:hypothetical protein